jgi:hypothetical protein
MLALLRLPTTTFPIALLTFVPAMTPTAPIINIIAAARIIIIIIPAISRAIITRAPIIIIIAAAVITGPNAHAAIIAIVIGAAAHGSRTGKANRSQQHLSGPRHRLSPFFPTMAA